MANQGIPQFGSPFTDQFGNITQVWYQFLVNLSRLAGGEGFAPSDSEYVLAQSDINLPNGDVASNSTTVTWDFSTSNQAKLHVTISSIIIPESQVTNLVADLADRALTSTEVIAGTGLTGGGPISANITVSVAPNGVTNSLQGQMASMTIKGNNTGSIATPQDLSVSQVQGMILNGATGTVDLAKLTITGANGSLTVSGGLITAFTNPT